jgi:hypothetical protein
LLALLLQRCRVVAHVEVEERAHALARRLARAHEPGAGREGARGRARALGLHHVRGFEGLLGTLDLDALAEQRAQEFLLAPQVAVRLDHQHALVSGRVRGHVAAAVREVVAQGLGAVGGQGRQVGPARRGLVVHRLAIGEDRARVATQCETGRCRLLVEDPDRTRERGPRVGVERAPGIGPLARVVGPAVLVEGARGSFRVAAVPLVEARRELGVVRARLWIEQEGVVRAHLVRIDEELRREGPHRLPAPARLRLRARHPVAVHVEQVVVAAPEGPAPAVHAVVVEVGREAGRLLDHRDDALAPVGVQARIDHDHEFVEQLRGLASRVGHEVVPERDGGVGAGELVPVDRVAHPRHGRAGQDALGLGLGKPARVGELGEVGAQRVEAREVLRRADGGPHELAPLVRAREGLDADARGLRGPGAEASQDLGMVRQARAVRLAEDRLGRRELRVVARAREEGGRVGQFLWIAEADRGRARRVARERIGLRLVRGRGAAEDQGDREELESEGLHAALG